MGSSEPAGEARSGGASTTAAPRHSSMANGGMDAAARGHGRNSGEQVSRYPMKFIVDLTAFDRTETVEVEASDVAEALRQACENTNISAKIREVDDPRWAHVEGFKSIP